MKTFLTGTLFLIIAAFIGECFEFVINMILARELGEEGMGHYMSILPVMFFIVVLASFELPISISKYVAEREKKHHWPMLKNAFQLAIWITLLFSLLTFLLLPRMPFFQHYHPVILWLFLILIPMISFSSIARGFFMGTHQMGKIAFSNGFRKFVQLGLLVLLFQVFEFHHELALLAAISAFIGSEAIVVIYLLSTYVLQTKELVSVAKNEISTKEIRQRLFHVSVPTTVLRIFHSLTHAIQPFLIKMALVNAGLSQTAAVEQFGLLSGVAMTIGFFPAFIAHSLLIVLIPSVSEAYANRDFALLKKLLQQSMLITFLYGIPAVMIIFSFGDSLTKLFFHMSSASYYLKMLWPYFFFHFLIIPLQAYLIGLNLIKDALFHTIWSHIVAFSIIYILGSMHEWQMSGVIIGLNAGGVLQFLLHYITICQKIGVTYFTLTRKQMTG
ncbi:polysaccharide biosynthesis protein [Bacillus sp. FJAT-47783]|uniref:polysaccharide biosynthesis protein n=1 Tax=Bacillus sp. FJAT-47783 TaxID=2922712 RepID=UPI001FAD2924|nr:polysaccharide biosynthesis protein [Bacillus sp. FJAT-47783]